jgi:hypothetical protein
MNIIISSDFWYNQNWKCQCSCFLEETLWQSTLLKEHGVTNRSDSLGIKQPCNMNTVLSINMLSVNSKAAYSQYVPYWNAYLHEQQLIFKELNKLPAQIASLHPHHNFLFNNQSCNTTHNFLLLNTFNNFEIHQSSLQIVISLLLQYDYCQSYNFKISIIWSLLLTLEFL